MTFAKIHITYHDGSQRICEAENKQDLGEQLNYVQDDIFNAKVREAMVEAIDETSKPFADMFNNLASNLEKLKNTQKVLYKSAQR